MYVWLTKNNHHVQPGVKKSRTVWVQETQNQDTYILGEESWFMRNSDSDSDSDSETQNQRLRLRDSDSETRAQRLRLRDSDSECTQSRRIKVHLND